MYFLYDFIVGNTGSASCKRMLDVVFLFLLPDIFTGDLYLYLRTLRMTDSSSTLQNVKLPTTMRKEKVWSKQRCASFLFFYRALAADEEDETFFFFFVSHPLNNQESRVNLSLV